MHAELAVTTGHFARDDGARVGPNAVIQLVNALREHSGLEMARGLFNGAGCGHLFDAPPTEMIDERVPAKLFAALWEMLPPEVAMAIAHDAGRKTGAYILANRIPRLAQWVLRGLPAGVAAPLLLSAIEKNAWTFAGSGSCRTAKGQPALITIERNPLAMPTCAWHRGVFECLFGKLVSRDVRIFNPSCGHPGHTDCRFALHF